MQQEFADAIVRSCFLLASLETGMHGQAHYCRNARDDQKSIALVRRVSPGASLHGLPIPIG
jgi:hypothetical protein